MVRYPLKSYKVGFWKAGELPENREHANFPLKSFPTADMAHSFVRKLPAKGANFFAFVIKMKDDECRVHSVKKFSSLHWVKERTPYMPNI